MRWWMTEGQRMRAGCMGRETWFDVPRRYSTACCTVRAVAMISVDYSSHDAQYYYCTTGFVRLDCWILDAIRGVMRGSKRGAGSI